jgi:hypothetical protein
MRTRAAGAAFLTGISFGCAQEVTPNSAVRPASSNYSEAPRGFAVSHAEWLDGVYALLLPSSATEVWPLRRSAYRSDGVDDRKRIALNGHSCCRRCFRSDGLFDNPLSSSAYGNAGVVKTPLSSGLDADCEAHHITHHGGDKKSLRGDESKVLLDAPD